MKKFLSTAAFAVIASGAIAAGTISNVSLEQSKSTQFVSGKSLRTSGE